MEVKIGLEIHVQLNTPTKLFCSCPNKEEEGNFCEICCSQPGAKPMLPCNEALEIASSIASLLGMKVEREIRILRKHYFYPDLPSGYQRTSTPLARDGRFFGVGIEELHIEEDPGRFEIKKKTIDYSRSGIPLVEIVTKPEFKDWKEVKEFLEHLKWILEFYDWWKEVMKADVNVSINNGERVEIKNVNSINNIVEAIKVEIKRQRVMVEKGLEIKRETRQYDEATNKTIRLRAKEMADDYRYMADPDLPPIAVPKPKLLYYPWEKMKEYMRKYNLSETIARAIFKKKKIVELFDAFAWKNNEFASFLLTVVLPSKLTEKKCIEETYKLLKEGKIVKKDASRVLEALNKGEDISRFLTGKEDELERVVIEVVEKNKKAVEDYHKGKKGAINFLLGEVLRIKRFEGRKVLETLRKVLEEKKQEKM